VPSLPEELRAGPVTLRRSRVAHLAAVMEAVAQSHAELSRWMPWADPMPSADEEAAALRLMEERFDADLDWAYLLFEPGDELVGGAGLRRRSTDTAEIGYWVRSDRTRRGYATAAAGALTAAAFACLPTIERVEIRMDQANAASAAVPPKLGYTLVGEEQREVVTSGHTGRFWIWSVSRPTS